MIQLINRREFVQLGAAGAAALAGIPGCAAGKRHIIDITGNWRTGESFLPHIQTSEPWLATGQSITFHQDLSLSTGRYTLELEYDANLDKSEGFALGGHYDAFQGLAIDGRGVSLVFQPESDQPLVYRAQHDLHLTRDHQNLHVSLRLHNTRVMTTRLHYENIPAGESRFQAIPPEQQGELLLVRGIPFLLRRYDIRFLSAGKEALKLGIDRGSLRPWNNGIRMECHGIRTQRIFCLGMIHNLDIGSGSWYSRKGDNGYSHFAGDRAGTLVLHWTGGNATEVPLVFGFNLWYSRPWDMIWHYNPYNPGPGGRDNKKLWIDGVNKDNMLFGGGEQHRRILQDGLLLVDGVRLMGAHSSNARYIFTIDSGGRALDSMEVRNVPEMYEYPVISAVTLETSDSAGDLIPLPLFSNEQVHVRPISPEAAAGGEYGPAVTSIQRTLYTWLEDLPILAHPVVPAGYFGPAYDFRGAPEAVYAATYLYRNGPECAAHIADQGTLPRSPVSSGEEIHYVMGTGVWLKNRPLYENLEHWFRLYRERSPGGHPGAGNAWSRGVGELVREAAAFGYHKYLESYLDWIDHALITEAHPPHWNRVIGEPSYATSRQQVGDIEERGVRENDGHGICMWGRYMAWHKTGRQKSWNERRWRATEASVEWIRWQLDTDTIRPGVRRDVLYTESECAHRSYDIYSSYNCLYGLKMAIRLAEHLGKRETIEQWTRLYRRLQQGILDHLVDTSDFGPVWHTEPDCDWQDHAHKLVHLHLAPDGDTFTPLQDYDAGDERNRQYLEISRNSYRALMRDKNYNCLRMYGYGQGMMTQAALLLDEMHDAEQFLKMLLRHCYLPRMAGWAAPEGIILHRSGKYYMSVKGYMGQDSHLADSTKAVRLLLGIDDNDPVHLRLVPRIPLTWTDVEIRDFPAVTGTKPQTITYRYERRRDGQSFEWTSRHPVERLSVRLGPLPVTTSIARADFKGLGVPFDQQQSGDSHWVWLRDLTGQSGRVAIFYR